MTSTQKTLEKHAKKIYFFIILFSCFLLLAGTEIFLSYFMGLGKPVLYESNKVYGYRPKPNQETKRFQRSLIKINNLGLRAEKDWDPSKKEKKILFLGDSVTYGGSYIANHELFSHLVGQKVGYEAGNAGVNAWGVENIAALIMDQEFLPAQIYITVLIEGDFYRGLTRIGHLPFWGHTPKYALKELAYFSLARLNHKRFTGSRKSKEDKKKFALRAAKRLKEMDLYLKEKGFKHLIFISPGKSQVLGTTKKSSLVQEALKKHQIKVEYLLDHIKIPKNKVKGVYYDGVHLYKKGHVIWADIMSEKIKKIIL